MTTVVVTPVGAAAYAALAEQLAELRHGDPLAAVDIAVPSSFVGVTVRRRLADPGLVGVRFTSLPRLIADRAAQVLLTTDQPPLTSAQRRAATRAALAKATGPLGESARRSASTADVVAAVFAELDDLDATDEQIDVLLTAGTWPTQLAGLYREYLALIKPALRPGQLSDAALQVVNPPPLVLYQPRRLTPVELEFCRALAERRLLRVVLTATGEEDTDNDIRDIRDALDPAAPWPSNIYRAPAATHALPDAEEEARFAVRRVFAHLDAHPEVRLDRIAIAYRASIPYARLIAEQLTAAGLPHHAPRQRALAQTVPGRTLLAYLALPSQQWSRVALLDWLRDTPIRDGTEHLPAARWETQACEAGVTRGDVTQWTTKLQRLAERMETVPVTEGETWPAEAAASARRLAAFVAAAVTRIEEIKSASSWTEVAVLVRKTLDHYLGGAETAASWGAHKHALADAEVWARCEVERDAYEETLATIDGLASLDAVAIVYSFDALRDVLDQELTHYVHEATGLGRGVLVGPLWDVAGADLDLLVIVGAAEGLYPPRGREHPLLREDVRAKLGLQTLAQRRRQERRDHLSALASAPTVVMTHPVADVRSQRGAEPAPWLLEQMPGVKSKTQKLSAPPSFQRSLCDDALPSASVSEFDIRLTVPVAPIDATHPLAQQDEAFARGLAAAGDRINGVFGPWTGGLSDPIAARVTERLDGTLSASSLQRYAECPFHYYLEQVLGVRALDEPDDDAIDRAERGSAVHDVLERMVQSAIDNAKPAAEPWSAAEHAEAQRLLDQHAERMLAEGKAGRPTTWHVHVTAWRRQLRQVLLADGAYRAAHGITPLAVEHRFGKDGAEPVVVELPSGSVQLAGFVDRIDRTADGDLVVLDYKSGRSSKYEEFPNEGDDADGADLTGRGQKLQLPLYALAARRDFGAATTPVVGYYWFVDEGGVRRGGAIDEAASDRFRDVLGVTAGGIRDGSFPARPGEFDTFFRSFESCSWCDFDRVCTKSRDDVWEHLRDNARVSAYAQLAEPTTDDESPEDAQ